MSKRFLLAVPFAALLIVATMSESTAQPPKKAKGDDKAAASTMVFECYKDAGGSYRFRIKDGDTTLGMASKGYDTMAECHKVCEAIQKGAAKAKIVEVKGDK